jgi:hypothetical protein
MNTKIADSKGRVSLGSDFAGRTVIVEETAMGITITPAVVIPEREAWLYKNKKAIGMLRKGLAEAAAGNFSDAPPELDADAGLADSD